jgi:hypothetical protein
MSDSVEVEPNKTQIAHLAREDLLPTRNSKKTISRETRRLPNSKEASGSRSLPVLKVLIYAHLSSERKFALFDEIGGNMSVKNEGALPMN